MAKKYFSGFTLIELMVVVGIIGILAMFAINSYFAQVAKANDAKRKAGLDRIKIAVEEYEKDHNCYPESINLCGSDATIPIHPYLSDVPCDPVTKAVFPYEPEPAKTCPGWFRMYATLQNTKDPAIIPGIGPGGRYNYYVSSPNAPVPAAPQGS